MNSQRPLILVVDDEAHIRHVLRLKLSGEGYRVSTAGDGIEAIEKSLAEQPALIITDFKMPYMSGLEFCLALRSNENTSHIPVMMLTARGFSLSSDKIKKAGVSCMLSKPFSPGEIVDRVREIAGDPLCAMEAFG